MNDELKNDPKFRAFTDLITKLFFAYCVLSGLGVVWLLFHSVIVTILTIPIFIYITIVGLSVWVFISREKQSDWIPISKRLPEVMESVLVQMKDGEMKVAYRAKRFIGNSVAVRTDWLLGNPNDVVIAWQPLPKAYEVSND